MRSSVPGPTLTEAAIGSGVTGVLLISAARTAARSRDGRPRGSGRSGLLRFLAAALCALVAVALAAVVLLLPDHGPSLGPESCSHLPKLGLGNPVTAVLIAYRSFDTMLEKVVLVLAVVGVWSLAADRYLGRRAGPRRVAERPEPTLAFLAQVAAAARHRGRHPHLLGRRGRAGRRVSGRRHSRRHVD